jgi:uncharacterized protein (TIGR02452 family)
MTLIERRKANIEIFENTKELYETVPKLKESITDSISMQRYYSKDEIISNVFTRNVQPANVIVSEKRSFEAAKAYSETGKRVCVLNFADWLTPGGWVLKGSSAQEESLCRCSTLYPCITDDSMNKQFYAPHKAERKKPMHILHNDDVIYTPGVIVFKSDIEFPEMLNKSEWYSVDVITCAAPRLRLRTADQKKLGTTDEILDIDSNSLARILSSRITRILDIAVSNEVEVIILGAFGCGAFKCPPEIVAKAFNDAIQNYLYNFETIEFPIFHRKSEDDTYTTFLKHITI